MIVLDKYGYPIEREIGHPINNFIRYCIHGRGLIQEHVWSAYQKRQIDYMKNSGCEEKNSEQPYKGSPLEKADLLKEAEAQLEKVRELSYQSGMSVDNNKLQAILGKPINKPETDT